MAGHARVKVVYNKHVVEVYEYEKGITYGKENGGRMANGEESERKEQNRLQTIRRQRETIRRLAIANFDSGSKFVTLTFRDKVTDIEQANKEFKKFIQRLRYAYGDFKYIAVIEFQPSGRVHYHMISNLVYVPNSTLSDIWKQGFVRINRISHVDNVGAYITKYMTKEGDDVRLQGHRAFQTSKGLDRALHQYLDSKEALETIYGSMEAKKVYTTQWNGEYTGKVTYTEYNLIRDNNTMKE